jgi:hypothetical protein
MQNHSGVDMVADLFEGKELATAMGVLIMS